jgi:hypothetical protein
METMRRVIDAVSEGWTRNMVTEGKRGNYIVCKRIVVLGKLNAFIKENSKLGKWLTKRLDENGRVVIAAGQAKLRKNVVKSALTTTIMDEIKAALTMWLDPVTERPDITSSIWWAVAEGQLKATDIKARAKEFVTAHRRGYTNTGRFAFNSLDGPVSDDNPTSRIERLTASDAMWVSECP